MNHITRYQVHGIIRRSSTFNTGRILHLYADRAAHTAGSENIDTVTLHIAGPFVFLQYTRNDITLWRSHRRFVVGPLGDRGV